jgi:hypothetical protein
VRHEFDRPLVTVAAAMLALACACDADAGQDGDPSSSAAGKADDPALAQPLSLRATTAFWLGARAYSLEHLNPYHPDDLTRIDHGNVTISLVCDVLEGDTLPRTLSLSVAVPFGDRRAFESHSIFSNTTFKAEFPVEPDGGFDVYAGWSGVLTPPLDPDHPCVHLVGSVRDEADGQLSFSLASASAYLDCEDPGSDVTVGPRPDGFRYGGELSGLETGYVRDRVDGYPLTWTTLWSESLERHFHVDNTTLWFVTDDVPVWERPFSLITDLEGNSVGRLRRVGEFPRHGIPILDPDIEFIGVDESGELVVER